MPCLIRGPSIPAGTVCGELTGTIDVLPTIAALTGRPLPEGRTVDGLDVSDLWTGKVEKSPRTEFVHYTSQGQLEGLRQGKWKLLVKKPRGRRNDPDAPAQVLLFDLEADLGESRNLAAEHPEIVKRLRERMLELDAEITENARAPWLKG